MRQLGYRELEVLDLSAVKLRGPPFSQFLGPLCCETKRTTLHSVPSAILKLMGNEKRSRGEYSFLVGVQCFSSTQLTLHTRSERKRRDGLRLPQRWPLCSARASVSPKVQAPPSHQVYWIHTSAGEDKAVLRAQSRMQKSRLSRKGFSAAGTGVTSGSSFACVSQKVRSSAAACDTCRRGAEMQLTRPNALVPGRSPNPRPIF